MSVMAEAVSVGTAGVRSVSPLVELDMTVRVAVAELAAALFVACQDDTGVDALDAVRVRREVAYTVAWEGMAALRAIGAQVQVRGSADERARLAACERQVRQAFGIREHADVVVLRHVATTGGGAERSGNGRLAALMAECGMSRKGLGRRVRDVAARHGERLGCDHVAVGRWLAGVMPQPPTRRYIAEALTAALARPVSLDELGMAAGLDPAQRLAVAA